MTEALHLHSTEIVGPGATPDQWLLLLHGIYGAGRNWSSVGRRLVRERPEWGVLAVDLRGHGNSPRMEPPHSIAACAMDLEELVVSGGYPATGVIGHSFGGKVALEFGRSAKQPPEQVWVVDSTPDVRPPGGTAWNMLAVLREHPGPFPERSAVVDAVASHGFPIPVAQWMATNAVSGEDGMVWRLDAEQMETLLTSFFETDAWEAVEAPRDGTHLHFIKATESGVLAPESVERIRAAEAATGRVSFHEVEGGHWLNADNPHALHELLLRHL
ncbi:MAG: alpha/beta fold hydrolase [Longimicrobiales bacterium]